ncbi:hypothetical protein D3C76_1054660 [compost metagenome]
MLQLRLSEKPLSVSSDYCCFCTPNRSGPLNQQRFHSDVGFCSICGKSCGACTSHRYRYQVNIVRQQYQELRYPSDSADLLLQFTQEGAGGVADVVQGILNTGRHVRRCFAIYLNIFQQADINVI